MDINLPLGTQIEKTVAVVRAIEAHISSDLKTGPERPAGITDWSSFIGKGPNPMIWAIHRMKPMPVMPTC
jgi:hypothetical protein